MVLVAIVLFGYSTDSLVRHYLGIGEIEKAQEMCLKNRCDTFLLGEIAYFNYKFEQAVELYSKVPANSKDANDALSRIILIKGNNDKEMQDYVTAELLGRQGKIEDGIKILRKLQGGDSLNITSIAPWAYILVIELLKREGKYEVSLKECQAFIKKFVEHEKLPQVKLTMGKIYASMGNKKEASQIYKEILLKHPNSSVAPIAREELENL